MRIGAHEALPEVIDEDIQQGVLSAKGSCVLCTV